MEQTFKGRFFVSYENCSFLSYLVIHIPEAEKIIRFQVEMLKYNPAPNRVLTDLRYKDGEALLYCDITSKVPLSFFIQRTKLTTQLFTDLMLKITDILTGCAGYLLEEDKFLLEEEFIFINPADNSVSLVYVPVKKGLGEGKGLRKLASELAAVISDLSKEDSSGFIGSVLSFAKSDGFSVRGFRNLLAGIGEKPDIVWDENPDSQPDKLYRIKENKVSVPFTPNGEKTSTGKAPVKTYALIGILQALILAVVLFAPGVLKSFGAAKLTDFAAVFLIAAAVDVLFVRHLLNCLKREACKQHTTGRPMPALPEENLAAAIKEKKDTIPIKEEASREDVPASRMETAILNGAACGLPVLSAKQDGISEEIHITGDDFVIGRLRGQADYISKNTAVGRLHARITNRGGKYFLTDLNSRNGSFINGNRLDGCMEYPISNGDIITLANRDYTFLC